MTLEAMFEELETELGEEIPKAIIEAQRRYEKESMRGTNRLAPMTVI